MERGRDGRRSGADRHIAAPRRPRTSGFKDDSAAAVAVGEDGGDDINIMDDVVLHNARLRERPKKDNTSSSNNNINSCSLLMMSSGKQQQRLVVSPSSLVSIRRIKRKRQGLHEIQATQLRSHLPDEVEETTPTTITHDSAMGGSEEEEDDDDDLPPPAPIPRRPVKARPQGKLEEIISMRRNDLPTVPRKARSVLKQRAQESPPPLPPPTVPPEILPHPPPPSVVASSSPNTPAPSSTLSSSSGIFALKPRRRTVKPGGSKPKVTKLLKVSTWTVSEEVEVAEALFDLARMIPSPFALNRRMDSKPEYKSEAKSCFSASVQITSPVAQPSNGTATPPLLTPVANTTSTVPLGASPPPAASPVLPPSPSSAAALPPEEAPKRKRPQVRTCPEEGVLPLQAHLVASTANVTLSNLPGVVAAPESREFDQVEEQHLVGITEEEGTLKIEATGNRSSPTPAPSSPGGTAVLSVSTVSIQPNIIGENKHETPEKKNAKGDVAITSPNEKNLSYVLLPFDGNPESAKLAAAISDIQEVDAGTISSPLLSDSAKQLDVVKRSVQLTPEGELDQVNKFDIDLMAPPTKAAAVSLVHKRNNGVAGVPVDKGQGKPLVDLSVLSPVGSGLSEKYKEERQEQQDREETHREMKREQRSKDRERTDLSKPPPQRASKGVKPESRLPKSEKALASSLLASSAASPISPGMTGWPGAMSSLGYFPVAAASMTGSSSVDKNPQPRVSPFSNIPPQQPWKRCASHVWIAHFIDAHQQVNRHPFFVAGLYGAKSYNQNMSLLPPGALYGSSGGAAQVPSVPGSPMSSAIALGVGLGVGEGALGATTISAAKDREREMIAAATFMEVFSQNAVLQQQQPILSLQPGAIFGSSGMQPETIMMASSGLSAEVVSGIADGGANMGNPALPGISSGPGRGSLMAGSLGPAGQPGIVASNQVVAAANAVAIHEQCLHVLKQNLGSPYHQYPSSHFGPTFNGPPANMGTQQAAAQFFAGVPFFGQQLVSPSQQSAHQTSLVASGGGPVTPQNQQQQGVHRFPPTGSPHQQQCPLQTPFHSPSQYQVQSQSERDGWDGPSGEDSGSVVESKFPISHRHPYSQGSASVANVSIPPAAVQTQPSHQDFSIFAALGKQNKWEHQQQQQHAAAQQLQVSQPQPSLSSHQHQQQQAAAQHLQIKLKGLDPQSSQAFSAMTMAAAMNRGPAGPGPLGLAPVAAVMAPQGHAVLQSMVDAVRIHPRQSPHHSSGSGAPHPSLIQQQQQQQQQLQFQQQQQQHRSVQMQRGPMGVEEGHTVADASNHTSNTGARRERDPGQDRKMSVKRPIGSSSPLSRVDFDTTPTRGNTHNETPTLNSIAATSAIISTHPTGHIAKGGVPPPVAQAIQAPKQSMVHTKGRPGANTASTAALNQSSMVSYADNGPPAAPSLTAKVSVPGISLAGQTATSASNGARQTPIAQHPCLNPSQRTSMGMNPTSPGTDPKVVLAAAMAKVQKTESKLQQSLLPQVALDTVSVSRIPSAVSVSPVTSSTPALSPLPAGSKPSAADGAKQGSFGKGSSSFPTAQKSVGAVPGNQALSPALSQHVILGQSHSPSLGNKSLSAKLLQQQQQYPQPLQMHKQQNPQQQQQLFQQQQFTNSQSQLLPSPPPQHPQQLLQQPQHSPPLTQAHLQQNPTHQHPVQHLNQEQSAPSYNGNIGNPAQSSISEVINDLQATNATPAPSNLSVSPLPGSGSQRGSSSSAPAVLHPQCSSLQELNSPEQLNSVRSMKVPAPMRTATSPPPASPSPMPELSSVQQIGSPTQGKLSTGQFVTGSNHGDKMLSQSSLMQPVTPSSTINGSSNHPANSNISNGHIGSDVQPPTIVVGSSAAVQQGNVNSFQMHPPLSLNGDRKCCVDRTLG